MHIDLREIPAVYINLPRHTEKNESMQTLLRECGFRYTIRVDGVNRPDNPIAGASAAHYRALGEIAPPFILFEDDCRLKYFRPEITIPNDADAVYLGVSRWGRMNAHSGHCVEWERVDEELLRIHNMLSIHAVLYLNNDYTTLCRKIAHHAGYVIENYVDIGIAEIQRWFKVYAFNNPFFYQTSNYHATINPQIGRAHV